MICIHIGPIGDSTGHPYLLIVIVIVLVPGGPEATTSAALPLS